MVGFINHHDFSGDSWMYLYQRTPSPFLSDGIYGWNNPQESQKKTINTMATITLGVHSSKLT